MNENFSYSGTKSLEVLQDAKNYNLFLENELVAFIYPEKQILDFGAGIGEFSQRMRSRGGNITCVELDVELQEILKRNKFIVYSSINEASPVSRIYSLNVLEHIEDDVAALRDINAKLNDGGKIFLYVPAFMCLYTALDRHIGHFRRYKRRELIDKLRVAGFRVERAEYVDSVGFVCWFFMGKMPGNKTVINPVMVKIFDRFLFPISRLADNLFCKLFGKNLLVIASKIK